MRTVMVLVMLPRLQLLPRILHRNELVEVQELTAQPTVERLDEPVRRMNARHARHTERSNVCSTPTSDTQQL